MDTEEKEETDIGTIDRFREVGSIWLAWYRVSMPQLYLGKESIQGVSTCR